jgi:hypothetical protein
MALPMEALDERLEEGEVAPLLALVAKSLRRPTEDADW